MIIYFSGTGNSLYAAKNLLDGDEKLISMAELMNNGDYAIELDDNERLGFVFPVYFIQFLRLLKSFWTRQKPICKSIGVMNQKVDFVDLKRLDEMMEML